MNQHNVHVWHLIVGWAWYKTFTLKENIIQVNKNFVNIIEPWNEKYKGNGAISEILWSGNQLKVRVRVRKQNKSQPKPFLQMTRNTCWTELWAMSFWFCIHKRMKEFGLGKWKFYLENSWKKKFQGYFSNWQCPSNLAPIKTIRGSLLLLLALTYDLCLVRDCH